MWLSLSSLAYNLTLHLIPSHIWLIFNLCLHVVSGEKPAQEEKTGILCQHPNCPERRLASKVSHQNVSQGSPVGAKRAGKCSPLSVFVDSYGQKSQACQLHLLHGIFQHNIHLSECVLRELTGKTKVLFVFVLLKVQWREDGYDVIGDISPAFSWESGDAGMEKRDYCRVYEAVRI